MEGVVIDVKIFSRIDDQVVEKDRGERIGEVRRLEGDEKIARQRGARCRARRDARRARRSRWRSRRARSKRRFRPARSSRGRSLRELKLVAIDLKTFRVENKKMNERIREIIDACERREGAHRGEGGGADRPHSAARRAAAGRDPAREGLSGREAQGLGRRQDGRPPRQQGYRRAHRARGGHAVPPRRPSGRHRAQPARRAEPNERRADPRDAPRVGRAKMLGFYAKTPVFQGANEREIGLLLKLAGADVGRAGARAARAARRASPTRTSRRCCTTSSRIARGSEAFVRLEDATINDLGGRDDVAGDARHLPPRPRLPRRGGEGAGRARARRRSRTRSTFHTAWVDDEAQSPTRSARVQGGAQGSSRSAARSRAGGCAERSRAAGARGDARQEVGSGRRCGGDGADAPRRADAVRQGAAARRSERARRSRSR